MTDQRTTDEIRKANAQKRIPPDKLLPEAALNCRYSDELENQGLDGLSCPEPTPEFAVLAMENLENWLSLLDEEPRKVALLKLAGYKNSEIAEQLQTPQRNIERRLALIRKVWEEAGATARD